MRETAALLPSILISPGDRPNVNVVLHEGKASLPGHWFVTNSVVCML